MNLIVKYILIEFSQYGNFDPHIVHSYLQRLDRQKIAFCEINRRLLLKLKRSHKAQLNKHAMAYKRFLKDLEELIGFETYSWQHFTRKGRTKSEALELKTLRQSVCIDNYTRYNGQRIQDRRICSRYCSKPKMKSEFVFPKKNYVLLENFSVY